VRKVQNTISERTVGAALRGRPRLSTRNSRIAALGFGEYDFNQGRPRRAAPTVRSEMFSSLSHLKQKQVTRLSHLPE